MMCYKDRNFCLSRVSVHTCGREITIQDWVSAEKMGLYISGSYYCGQGDDGVSFEEDILASPAVPDTLEECHMSQEEIDSYIELEMPLHLSMYIPVTQEVYDRIAKLLDDEVDPLNAEELKEFKRVHPELGKPTKEENEE